MEDKPSKAPISKPILIVKNLESATLPTKEVRDSTESKAPESSTLTIDSGELLLQFCKENSLQHTLEALQEESQVSLNTVDSLEDFNSGILKGNWDSVLQDVSYLKLPFEKLADLYEQIVLEMVELRETETAKTILRQTEPMKKLKHEQPERYLRLERITARMSFEPSEAYPSTSKEKRRAAIAQALSNEVSVVKSGRLMSLLYDALKFHQLGGGKFDLFRGAASSRPVENETYPTRLDRTIKFGTKSHAECARFSPDGQYLVTGSVDGFLEVWNYETGKLNMDLQYQADDEVMMHEESILCLNFSPDATKIASGSKDGKIKVWEIKTGKCTRKFDGAHTQGVTCISFTKDGSQLLTGSFDYTARIHGLKSGKTLKIFRGHNSYVNECILAENGTKVITASSDSSIKLWDQKTTDCIYSFTPFASINPNKEATIHSIILDPKNPEQIYVCSRMPAILVINLKGKQVRSFESRGHTGDFICCTLSPQGDYLYAVSDDNSIVCFNTQTGRVEHTINKAHEKETIGISHHPSSQSFSFF